MTFDWQYPIYLLPIDQGYASLVDANGREQAHSLIVCTDLPAALDLMSQCNLLARPRALQNAREFRWLLQSLREPITLVAFDPTPTDQQINARWQVSVATLLEEFLPSDNSPWNYPVYAIGRASGFACIETTTEDATALRALGIFTSTDAVEKYLVEADEPGELIELPDLDTAATFLDALKSDLTAVAIDPRVVDGRHTANYCLGIDVLLAKYLVRTN